jgi:hypothetical protein
LGRRRRGDHIPLDIGRFLLLKHYSSLSRNNGTVICNCLDVPSYQLHPYKLFLCPQTSSDGSQKQIEGAASSSYTLNCNDIGFYISVLCEPVRSDGVHGSLVSTEESGPILPGPPTCLSLELAGPMVEGGCLTFHAEYTGG